MKRIRVAMVDDHKIIRDGITSLFKNDPEIEITRDFENGIDLLKGMETEEFDLILLDMHMPQMGGIDTAKEVLKTYPGVKILIHTMSEIVDEIEQVVRLGAHGYILKTAGQQELSTAIKVISFGSSYFSSEVMNSFIRSCIEPDRNPLKLLGSDELRVLALISSEELSMYELSVRLSISEDELTTQLNNIKRKLSIQTDLGLGKLCGIHQRDLMVYK